MKLRLHNSHMVPSLVHRYGAQKVKPGRHADNPVHGYAAAADETRALKLLPAVLSSFSRTYAAFMPSARAVVVPRTTRDLSSSTVMT